MGSVGFCDICHRWSQLDTHHVYGASFRNKSEKYGAVVEICRECHDDLHHRHPKKYLWLKREWRDRLMAENGWTTEDFIKEFGRAEWQ